MHTWGTAAEVKPSSGGLASGYMFEIRTIPSLPATRDEMLRTTYARAMTPDALRALVGSPALRDLVSDVEGSIANAYDATTSDEAERSWRWRTSMFARFHPGSVPWRLSLSGWPVIPILDRALLRTMIELPRASMFDRKLQDALLARRLPELARLPLDRNALDVRPLAPSFVWRAKEAVSEYVQRLTPASGVQAIRAKPADERRYYVRIYDFDNPGWQRVRAAAEPGRSALAEWFDLRALASLVPAPDQPVRHTDPIAQGFAPKTLVGLMRWMTLRTNGS